MCYLIDSLKHNAILACLQMVSVLNWQLKQTRKFASLKEGVCKLSDSYLAYLIVYQIYTFVWDGTDRCVKSTNANFTIMCLDYSKLYYCFDVFAQLGNKNDVTIEACNFSLDETLLGFIMSLGCTLSGIRIRIGSHL